MVATSERWKLDSWEDVASLSRHAMMAVPPACLRLQFPIPFLDDTPLWAVRSCPDYLHPDVRPAMWHGHPAVGDHPGVTGVAAVLNPRVSYLTFYGILPRSMYQFRVRAVNAVGPSNWSDGSIFVKTTRTAPLPPGKVRLKGAASTLLSLFWAPSRANGYPVLKYELQFRMFREPRQNHIATEDEEDAMQTDDWATIRNDLVETFCLVPGLRFRTGYIFRVRGFNKVGWSLWSEDSDIIYTPRLLT